MAGWKAALAVSPTASCCTGTCTAICTAASGSSSSGDPQLCGKHPHSVCFNPHLVTAIPLFFSAWYHSSLASRGAHPPPAHPTSVSIHPMGSCTPAEGLYPDSLGRDPPGARPTHGSGSQAVAHPATNAPGPHPHVALEDLAVPVPLQHLPCSGPRSHIAWCLHQALSLLSSQAYVSSQLQGCWACTRSWRRTMIPLAHVMADALRSRVCTTHHHAFYGAYCQVAACDRSTHEHSFKKLPIAGLLGFSEGAARQNRIAKLCCILDLFTFCCFA